MKNERDFPEDFIWGSATSAYQVEGGAHEDGKGPSIWTEFEKRPGAILDNGTGDVASDQYHHVSEDIALMKQAGMTAYRFSLAWSRIFPEGNGKINEKGLDYYKRLCDELLANGIEPYVTLYHWDLPLALQERYGGWESRETVKLFGEYAFAAASALGDRVGHYFTTNEFLGCSDAGYAKGLLAPGLRLSPRRRNQVRHHLLLAHGTALQALRSAAPDAEIGLAENPKLMIPAINTPEHVDAAKKAFREINAHFLTALLEGGYPECYLEAEKGDAPVVEDGDFKLISAPIDFLGLNVYFGQFVRADREQKEGYKVYKEYPDDSSVLFQPEAMYWGCRIVHDLWHPKRLIVSENGLFGNDRPEPDGEIYDLHRIKYLRAYMASLSRTIKEDIPVRGYFHWSLLDNLEWNAGFRQRFGLVFVNYHTTERIPKLSYRWYSELIRTGRLV